MRYIYKTFSDRTHDDNDVQQELNDGHSAGWTLVSFNTTFISAGGNGAILFALVWDKHHPSVYIETDES